MAGFDLLGGVGLGISRGAQDWRAWDEEKRRKQLTDIALENAAWEKEQRGRQREEQKRQDKYREGVQNLPVEGDGKPIETQYQMPDASYFDEADRQATQRGLKRVQQTAAPAEVARQRAALASNVGLPDVAEKQTDRYYTLQAQQEADRQRKVMSGISTAALTLHSNPMTSLKAMEPVLEGTGAKLIIEGDQWGLALPGASQAMKPKMQPINSETVAKAMEHAIGYLNSENYFKTQSLGIEGRKAGAAERTADAAVSRAGTDAFLAPSQARLYGAQAGYYDRMPKAANTTDPQEKLPFERIYFPETGQYGWARPRFDNKTGIATHILPKGAVVIKGGDEPDGQSIDLGDLKEGGWSGLRQQNFKSGGWEIWGFQNGQRRLYAASPGRGEGNRGSSGASPSVGAAAARMGGAKPNVNAMPGAPTAPASTGYQKGIFRESSLDMFDERVAAASRGDNAAKAYLQDKVDSGELNLGQRQRALQAIGG